MQINTEAAASIPQEEAYSKQEQKKIDHLERIIDNLNQHWHSIQLLLGHISKPLMVDDRGLGNTLHHLRDTLKAVIDACKELDISQAMSEIKFIGKRLDCIEKSIEKIKKDGVDRHVKLSLTLDGYSMVKKQINHDPEMPVEDPNKALDDLLRGLPYKLKKTLIYRFGLYGGKKHTYVAAGKKLYVSGQQIRMNQAKALQFLRGPSRKGLVEKINHPDLYKEITGNDLDDK